MSLRCHFNADGWLTGTIGNWNARRTAAAGERACWRYHPESCGIAGNIHAARCAAKGAEVAETVE